MEPTWLQAMQLLGPQVCILLDGYAYTLASASLGGCGREGETPSWRGYISLGMGWARCFLRMTNQLPNFHVLWVGAPPNQSLLSPGQRDRPLQSSASACAILTSTVLPFPGPTPIWYRRGGRALFLYSVILLTCGVWASCIYILVFHVLSVRISPFNGGHSHMLRKDQ